MSKTFEERIAGHQLSLEKVRTRWFAEKLQDHVMHTGHHTLTADDRVASLKALLTFPEAVKILREDASHTHMWISMLRDDALSFGDRKFNDISLQEVCNRMADLLGDVLRPDFNPASLLPNTPQVAG